MAEPDVAALTADYEQWLGEQIPLDAAELEAKHAAMRAHEYRFLRGTYYLWLVRVGDLLPDVLSGPRVPLVGDLHVENFGTWRDVDRVRRWGVNDLDELATGPWLLDLLRLATSAVLAPHITLPDDDVCAVLLDTWRTTVPRIAVSLTEDGAAHLEALVPAYADRDAFYARLASGPPADVPDGVARAAVEVAERGWQPTWHAREAGTGSLGHRRVVGVGPADDGAVHAREAKQLGPGTALWAARRVATDGVPTAAPELYDRVGQAVRGPAGSTRVDGWQVRDLAPDVARIGLAGLRHHPAERLLRAMARATADVHGSDPRRFVDAVEAAGRLSDADFRHAVGTMAASTRADFAAYRGSVG